MGNQSKPVIYLFISLPGLLGRRIDCVGGSVDECARANAHPNRLNFEEGDLEVSPAVRSFNRPF